MRSSDFRWVFLIYCLDRQPDGSYVALNRRYKPVGMTLTEFTEYAQHPVGFKFKRALSALQIGKLDCEGRTDPQRIQLYNDGCIPTDSDANWKAYSERLGRLAAYQIEY